MATLKMVGGGRSQNIFLKVEPTDLLMTWVRDPLGGGSLGFFLLVARGSHKVGFEQGVNKVAFVFFERSLCC